MATSFLVIMDSCTPTETIDAIAHQHKGQDARQSCGRDNPRRFLAAQHRAPVPEMFWVAGQFAVIRANPEPTEASERVVLAPRKQKTRPVT
jgi:hypothetical protein